MEDFERLGRFYLGRECDPETGEPREDLLLYDSKDLTTHAVIVGMTGSGKTGLGIGLLEEAAIDAIPSIVIDPKGDLGNLLLAFPKLEPADFRPWIDPTEAAQAGRSVEAAAEETAKLWKEGLAKWGQGGERVARFAAAAEATIYTPGSNAGVPVSVLRSFAAPPAAVRGDEEAMRERVGAAASGVLALLGVEADPMRSREHMLLANILDRAWRAGESLDLPGLIHAVQKPPFDRIGVLPLDSAFPEKERFELAMSLNGLLAAPGFSAWMEGEPLDVQRLLWTETGKPRISIMSIAHLSDAERMFFVTTLLNEVVTWMRAQAGTPSLRAILYMDEVFGFFPPSRNPPAKLPMLTLLKQARAYGLGVVLATQNPVDLDYKGLGNAGTWFLGRLQTERDKLRVLDGLEGASATSAAAFDRSRVDRLLSGLKKRRFLMSNAHEAAPVLFETRWALSYLRGPLTRAQIQTLMAGRKAAGEAPDPGPEPRAAVKDAAPVAAAKPVTTPARPAVPPGVVETWLPPGDGDGATVEYRPEIAATAKIRYADRKTAVDHWETLTFVTPVPDDGALDPWDGAREIAGNMPAGEPGPRAGARFADLPPAGMRARSYEQWARALKAHVLRTRTISVRFSPDFDLASRPGETEGEFRARLALAARERRDAEVARIRERYAERVASLQARIRAAEGRVEHGEAKVSESRWRTLSSFGSAVLGMLFGRKVMGGSTGAKASRAMRDMGRSSLRKADLAKAEGSLDALLQRRAELTDEIDDQVARVRQSMDPAALPLEEVRIAPKRGDISVARVELVWNPGEDPERRQRA